MAAGVVGVGVVAGVVVNVDIEQAEAVVGGGAVDVDSEPSEAVVVSGVSNPGHPRFVASPNV